MSRGIRLSSVARGRLRLTSTDPYAGALGSTPVPIVPGLRDSGVTHWQTPWEAERPEFKLVRAGDLATSWGSRLIGYRNAGHTNAEAGYGPWPDGLRLLRQPEVRAARADVRPALPRTNGSGDPCTRQALSP